MSLRASRALSMGIKRAVRNWRFSMLVYAVNLLFASLLALPFASVMTRDISRSVVGARLLAGFGYRWYVEFVNANAGYFHALLPQIVLLISLYVAMEAFLAGGFYLMFIRPVRTRAGAFFSAGASKFLQIAAVTSAEILLIFLLCKGDVLWVPAKADPVRAALIGYLALDSELWRYGIVIAAFMVVNLFFDFVRAAVAIDDESFFGKIRRGFAFVVRHPVSSTAIYLACALLQGGLVELYILLKEASGIIPENAVTVWIAAGQIFILLRIFSKLIFYAGEAVLYKENQIEVIEVKPEMLE